ncbi:MAG: lipoyl synthase [Thermoplasmata archaeon]|nr:lipoyl synthase [Thermoplasmata archaeon]
MATTLVGTSARRRLPEWIRVRPPVGPQYPQVRGLLATHGLSTVCQEARCPNLPECWSAGTATLMLLGTDCTRRCAFCAVNTHWPRGEVDPSEPERVAQAVRGWGLRYVVLTQVCRDDLDDGGASVLAETVRLIRARCPGTLVELLIGDLAGRERSLRTVVDAQPDVLAHNLETVRRLSSMARDHRAGYDQSLELLGRVKRLADIRLVTKSSLMLGLGEGAEELAEAFDDLRVAGVDLLTLGQYLQPSAAHAPVVRFPTPDEFGALRAVALGRGFAGVESGPLIRSSYRAEELYRRATDRRGA